MSKTARLAPIGFTATCQFLLALFLALSPLRAFALADVDVHFFWSQRCPHCLQALPQLQEMAAQNPWLRLHEYEITQSPDNLRSFQAMAEMQGGGEVLSVPTLFYCGRMEVGWPDDPAGRSQLLSRFKACQQGTVPKRAAAETRLSLPLFGNVDLSTLSLPVLTVLLASLDAFNPCAFFVLLFLLSLLTHQRQRSRMLLVGGVFVLCSGAMYFAFMAAWLNVFLIFGNLYWITATAGALALIIGGLNLKDYFIFQLGPTLSMGSEHKAKIFRDGRQLTQSSRLSTMLIATALLAIAANFYELLCTAGFPMVFTRLLTLQERNLSAHYAYLLLYNLIYVLPLLLIVLAFVRTLGSRKLSEREGRLLKFLSGMMMSSLGVLLIVAPELLDQPGYVLMLPLAAVALTVVMARLMPRHDEGHR